MRQPVHSEIRIKEALQIKNSLFANDVLQLTILHTSKLYTHVHIKLTIIL